MIKAEELKKAYQKMSRQLKKAGLDYKCVMTARQQELGTATICFAGLYDHETRMKKAEKSLADEAGSRREAEKKAKEAEKNMTLYRKWAQEGEHNEFWKGIVEAYETGKLVELELEEVIKAKKNALESAKEAFEKHGTIEEQRKRNRKNFEELKSAGPLKEFCSLAGAKVELEYKMEYETELWYLRFHY
jgi:hypothetical protein